MLLTWASANYTERIVLHSYWVIRISYTPFQTWCDIACDMCITDWQKALLYKTGERISKTEINSCIIRIQNKLEMCIHTQIGLFAYVLVIE